VIRCYCVVIVVVVVVVGGCLRSVTFVTLLFVVGVDCCVAVVGLRCCFCVCCCCCAFTLFAILLICSYVVGTFFRCHAFVDLFTLFRCCVHVVVTFLCLLLPLLLCVYVTFVVFYGALRSFGCCCTDVRCLVALPDVA